MFGCGSNANATYNGFTASELAESNTSILDTLLQMSEDELFDAAKELQVPYDDYGEVAVTEANGTTTVEQTVNFTKRDIKITIVYDKNMQAEDITIDKVYTLGETMIKAAMNTAMGMGTVFVMLIIISLIISCFTLVNKAQKKAEDKKAANAPAPTAAPAAVEVPQTDDLELVAVIAAAIAAATGSSTDDFVVRSIKRR